MGLVDEGRLAGARDSPGDALVEAKGRLHDLVRPLVTRQHWSQHLLPLVRLVDRERVVGNQVVERVGDPDEQRVEALLGEDLVEDVGQPPIGIDELGRRRGQERILRQEPKMRGRPHNHRVQASRALHKVESPG